MVLLLQQLEQIKMLAESMDEFRYYSNLCFSCYWVFCRHCLLKGTDPHSVFPEESSLSGLIGLSSSLVVTSLGSRVMLRKILTADHLNSDHLGTHKMHIPGPCQTHAT